MGAATVNATIAKGTWFLLFRYASTLYDWSSISGFSVSKEITLTDAGGYSNCKLALCVATANSQSITANYQSICVITLS